MEAHFGKTAKELLTKVCKDTSFRSRYQVTLAHEDDLNRLLKDRITINGIRIRGDMDRKIQAVRPVRFYIPNLPSFLNEDDVYDPFSEEQPAYVKQRIHKDFGIPSGGFFVGFQAAEKADRLVDFEGEPYKMVCLDKPRERYQQPPNPSHNDPDQGNAPVDPILKMTPSTRKPPRIPNGRHPTNAVQTRTKHPWTRNHFILEKNQRLRFSTLVKFRKANSKLLKN